MGNYINTNASLNFDEYVVDGTFIYCNSGLKYLTELDEEDNTVNEYH